MPPSPVEHVLGVLEAETGHVPDRAGQPALVLAEETLGRIFNHRQMVFLGQGHDGIHVAGQPVQVHGHDRLRPGRNAPLDVPGIHGKRVGIDVGEDGTAFWCKVTAALEMTVKAGEITSSPGPTPAAARQLCKVDVPELCVMA